MKLVVGLGNPGPRYVGTRHNVGFEVVDRLVSSGAASWKSSPHRAAVAELKHAGSAILLAKPLTFMNLSGEAVHALMAAHRLPPASVLVVHDELDLPLGVIRLRPAGRAGGHHGVESIIERVGEAFGRLRLGIGRPPERGEGAHHVLAKFEPGEQEAVERMVLRATEAAKCWWEEGLEAAMNRFN